MLLRQLCASVGINQKIAIKVHSLLLLIRIVFMFNSSYFSPCSLVFLPWHLMRFVALYEVDCLGSNETTRKEQQSQSRFFPTLL
jgi:hypothetical protein